MIETPARQLPNGNYEIDGVVYPRHPLYLARTVRPLPYRTYGRTA